MNVNINRDEWRKKVQQIVNVDIHCLDASLSCRVSKELAGRINSMTGKETALAANYEDSLFSQGLRLLRSYSEIKINSNVFPFLEAAKEEQLRQEFIYPQRMNFDMIIRGHSFLVEMSLLKDGYRAKAMIPREIIRKMIFDGIVGDAPDYIFYLKPDLKAFSKRRRATGWPNRKAEIRMDGLGATLKNEKIPKILKTFKEKRGIIYEQIECEDNPVTIDAVVNKIIEKLHEAGLIKTTEEPIELPQG